MFILLLWFHFHWCQLRIYHCSAFCSWTKKAIGAVRWNVAFNGLFHRGFPAKVEPIVESDPNEKEETPVIQWWMPMGCSRLIMVDRISTFSDIFFVDLVMGDTVSTIILYTVESYHHILWNWCMNVKFQVFEDWGIKPLEEHESSTCCRTPYDA